MKSRSGSIIVSFALLCCVLLWHGGAIGQTDPGKDLVKTYIDSMRLELSQGKVNLIGQAIKMDSEQAAIFWPLYQKYESELFAIGDQRLALIKRFLAAHKTQTLDDQDAQEMATEWFKQSGDRLDLLKKYYTLISDKMSPVQAIQFVQVENRVNMVIDIIIASEMPLFKQSN